MDEVHTVEEVDRFEHLEGEVAHAAQREGLVVVVLEEVVQREPEGLEDQAGVAVVLEEVEEEDGVGLGGGGTEVVRRSGAA